MKRDEKVVIGLLGTGKIGSAVMTGFCSEAPSGATDEKLWQPKAVYVSSRSKEKATRLQHKYPDFVTISDSNQDIIDKSDVIFIGLLPTVAKEILPTLNFPASKKIVSMMATIPYSELLELVKVPKENVVRSVPLPSSAKRTGPILAYPQNDFVCNLLSSIGTPVMVKTEDEITTMTGITGMISFFYATCGKLQNWCLNNGVDEGASRDFVAAFFKSLSQAGFESSEKFDDMAIEAATPGGLNEQTHNGMLKSGAYELMVDEVDKVYKRLTGTDPAGRPAKRTKLN